MHPKLEERLHGFDLKRLSDSRVVVTVPQGKRLFTEVVFASKGEKPTARLERGVLDRSLVFRETGPYDGVYGFITEYYEPPEHEERVDHMIEDIAVCVRVEPGKQLGTYVLEEVLYPAQRTAVCEQMEIEMYRRTRMARNLARYGSPFRPDAPVTMKFFDLYHKQLAENTPEAFWNEPHSGHPVGR